MIFCHLPYIFFLNFFRKIFFGNRGYGIRKGGGLIFLGNFFWKIHARFVSLWGGQFFSEGSNFFGKIFLENSRKICFHMGGLIFFGKIFLENSRKQLCPPFFKKPAPTHPPTG